MPSYLILKQQAMTISHEETFDNETSRLWIPPMRRITYGLFISGQKLNLDLNRGGCCSIILFPTTRTQGERCPRCKWPHKIPIAAYRRRLSHVGWARAYIFGGTQRNAYESLQNRGSSYANTGMQLSSGYLA